jgi:hypothetical protein
MICRGAEIMEQTPPTKNYSKKLPRHSMAGLEERWRQNKKI